MTSVIIIYKSNIYELITDYLINIIWITVENAFGMLSAGFQIFKKLIPFAPYKVDLFEMTC